MIEKLKKIGSDTDLAISGYGETDLSSQSTIFRITARGTGGRDTTQTLLRSHYAKSLKESASTLTGRLSWEQLFPSQ